MKRKYLLITIIGLLFFCGSVWGDEVTPFGSDRFITGTLVANSSASKGESVLLHASSSLLGKLVVTAETTDSAWLEAKAIVKTESRSMASEYTELVDMSIRRTRRGLEILFRTPNPAPWSGSDESVMIEGELHLPYDCQIKIDAEYFDLIIDGPFVSVENDKSYGRMDIRNITKVVELTGTNRDISLKNVSGDINVNLSHADLWIDEMRSEYRAARIKNDYGNVNIDGFEGEIIVIDSYGKIKMADIRLSEGKSSIEAVQCPINLSVESLDKTELFLSSTYEDIVMDVPNSAAVDFQLKTERAGEIHVQDIPIKPIKVESNYVELSSGKGGSIIKVGIEGGGNIIVNGFSE